ncbi:hypothetical protein CASFOL_038403 [Castilleja foliolosa]|uniref:Uncharacterized protein n=1 Tax=Castilleja foliolosa TaxID=1961234 RepID=A0ABD3BLD8_9LAMI
MTTQVMANQPESQASIILIADIEAKCLEETYGAKQEDVILYGQSVGSGPTVDIAARLSRLKAVVLHGPILSGLRVMYPVKRTYWFDIYKNIDKFSLGQVPCYSYSWQEQKVHNRTTEEKNSRRDDHGGKASGRVKSGAKPWS